MLIRQIQLDNFYPDRHLRLSGLEQGLHVVYATDPKVRRALMGAIPAILFGVESPPESGTPDLDAPKLEPEEHGEQHDDHPRCVGSLRFQDSRLESQLAEHTTAAEVTIELHQRGGPGAPATPQIVSGDGTPGDRQALTRVQAGITQADYFDHLYLTHPVWEALQDPTQATTIWTGVFQETGDLPPRSSKPVEPTSSSVEWAIQQNRKQCESFAAELRKLAESFAVEAERAHAPDRKFDKSDPQLADLAEDLQKLERQSAEHLQTISTGHAAWQAAATAHEVRRLRSQLAQIDEHLGELPDPDPVAPHQAAKARGDTTAEAELEACRSRWQKNHQRRQALAGQWRELAKSKITDAIADRIRRLLLQEHALANEATRIKEFGDSLTRRKAAVQALAPATNAKQGSPKSPIELSLNRALTDDQREALKAAARALKAARQQWKHVLGQHSASPPAETPSDSPPTSSSRQAGRFEKKIREARQRVVAWEHRVTLEDRLEGAQRNAATLREEAEAINSRSYLPAWANLPLALAFILGVALILASLWLNSQRRLGVMFLGLTSAVAAMLIKLSFDRIADRRYHIVHRGLQEADEELERLILDRDAFDERLENEVVDARKQLNSARRQLSQVENDRDTEPPTTRPSTPAPDVVARQQAAIAQAEGEYRLARHTWRQALAQLGLPRHLAPVELADLVRQQAATAAASQNEARQAVSPSALERLLDQSQDWNQRQGILSVWHEEADQLIQALDAAPQDLSWVRKCSLLRHQLSDHDRIGQTRQTLKSEIRQLRREAHQLRTRGRQLRRQIDAQTGLRKQEQATRELERKTAAAERAYLRQRRADLLAELAGLGDAPPDPPPGGLSDVVDQQAQMPAPDVLAQEITDAVQALEKLANRSQPLFHAILAAVRSLQPTDPPPPSPWDALDHQICQLPTQWQTLQQQLLATPPPPLSGPSTTTTDIRKTPEPHPATLLVASQLLQQLSADELLAIQMDETGQLPMVQSRKGPTVSVLQLEVQAQRLTYLALWLARLRRIANRQQMLPVVLDDLLDDFSEHYHYPIARTLQEFAAPGQQLILFTADADHIDLFASLDALIAPVAPLPSTET